MSCARCTGTKPEQNTTKHELCAWLLGYTVVSNAHNRHPIPCPHGWAMGCLMWGQKSEAPPPPKKKKKKKKKSYKSIGQWYEKSNDASPWLSASLESALKLMLWIKLCRFWFIWLKGRLLLPEIPIVMQGIFVSDVIFLRSCPLAQQIGESVDQALKSIFTCVSWRRG